jgi:RNA polymerase sigma factor (sigma-70 family)
MVNLQKKRGLAPKETSRRPSKPSKYVQFAQLKTTVVGSSALESPSKHMPPETSRSGTPEALSAECPPAFLAEHSQILSELHALANAARWGISREAFAAALYRSAACHLGGTLSDGAALEAYLRTLRLEDLALACALRLDSAHAWEEFVASYRPVLYAAARSIAAGRGEAYARELADSLYGELYGLDRKGTARRHSLLDYFHGRCKLGTWLRTVLAQRHVDAIRAGRQTESLPDSLLNSLKDSSDDNFRGSRNAFRAQTPSHSGNGDREPGDLDRARLMPQVREALLAAFAALAPAERVLCSLYYVDDLTLAHIARMRGVHEATVSRQLERIRRDLRETVERTLASGVAAENGKAARRGLTAAEIKLCFDYAPEDGSFDLSQALREKHLEST